MKKLLDRMKKIFSSKWWWLTIIILMGTGLFLCRHSFDYRYSHTVVYQALVHPLLNLFGILLLILPPYFTVLLYSLQDKTETVAIKIFYQICFVIGWITACLYSSSQGYLSFSAIMLMNIIGISFLVLIEFRSPPSRDNNR